jgi:hypothetical protein
MDSDFDLSGGLRAMSLFKRNPGPLEPGELNQAVKHELANSVQCMCELADGGVLSQPLIRELEQIVADRKTSRPMRVPSISLVIGSPGEDYSDGGVEWDDGVSGVLGRHMEMVPVKHY